MNKQQTKTSDSANEHSYPSTSEVRTSVSIKDILAPDVQDGFSPEPTALQHAPSPLLDDTRQGIFSGNAGNYFVPPYPNNLTSTKQVPRRSTAGSCHETDLLRHFRYQIGPWIDVGDPDCAFGIQLLLLSRSNRPLQAAILALSAGQRCFLTQPVNDDLQSIARFRKEAEEGLDIQPELVKRAGHVLLLLQDLLPVGIQRWRPQIEAAGGFFNPTAVTEGLGEPLFWLHFRLGKSKHNSVSI